MIFGNQDVWTALRTEMPRTATLFGPKGVGKFTGAGLLAQEFAGMEDVQLYQDVTVDDMRAAAAWARVSTGSHRFLVLEPGACHPNVYTLLKALLDDLPERTHVWVVDQYRRPLPSSIVSRCFTYQFAALTQTEMEAFLETEGALIIDQEHTTSLGGVDRVLTLNKSLAMKPAVASWLTAVKEANHALLLVATNLWGARHTTLLIEELGLQLEGRTLVCGATLIGASGSVDEADILQGLGILQDARNPRLGAISLALSLMK